MAVWQIPYFLQGGSNDVMSPEILSVQELTLMSPASQFCEITNMALRPSLANLRDEPMLQNFVSPDKTDLYFQ
jgi:hypothetical protein